MDFKNAGIFAAVLALGFGGGFIVGKGTVIDGGSQEVARLQAQIERAKHFFPPAPEEIDTLSGVITNVSGSVVAVDITLPNPFADLPMTRAVHITENTVITKLVKKSPAAYQRELAEFQRTIASSPQAGSAGAVIFPSPLTTVTGTMGDLEKGRSVTVIAGNDIATAESFYAKAIEVAVIVP